MDYGQEPVQRLRWSDDHVTWSFALQTYSEDQAFPFSGVISGDWQGAVLQAIDRWSAVSGLTFEQVADSPDHTNLADIRIGWGSFGPSATTIGMTAYYYNDGLLEPGVVVRLENPLERPIAPDWTGHLTYSGTSSSLYALALHEIGHALGLYHSADAQAVMYPTLGYYNSDLASSDIGTIRSLYDSISAKQFSVTDSSNFKQYYITGSVYSGPVPYLQYSYLGSEKGDIVNGTNFNDFINTLGGDDAISAGDGNDVLDGGTGSNFMTGGAGNDTFFLDGRGGKPTWNTISDWENGEQMCLWGWHPGLSRAIWVENGGLIQYRGITLHADLDGNGSIDASVTWTGISHDQLPNSFEFDGLLWFK